mmetsp:Transcript_1181/g.2917  ORF Transcript_1181/g.2917 Transcript_1181/m.2917 type:complete len:291 (+) Transcript_1181:67-939(+)
MLGTIECPPDCTLPRKSNSMLHASEATATYWADAAPSAPGAGCCAAHFLRPAIEVAPAGSSSARVSSKPSRIASRISSSETHTTSSTRVSHSRYTSSPSCGTQIPSTPGSSIVTREPDMRDWRSTSTLCGSTPMTLTVGLSCLTAAATPARSEPPPTGRKMASSGERAGEPCWRAATMDECCRRISIPAVACPARMSGSSWPCSMCTPSSAATRRAASSRASEMLPPATSTRAPMRSMGSRRCSGVVSGTTMVTGKESLSAAVASATPRLPTDALTAPLQPCRLSSASLL